MTSVSALIARLCCSPASAAAFADSAPYGAFSDNTDQPAATANTPVIVSFGTTDLSNGITLSNSNRLNVANDGVYNIQFSAQLQNTTNDAQYADIWFRVNTNDVVASASRFGIPARKNTGAPSHMIGAMNIYLDLNAGDYVQIVFAVSDVGVTLEHYAADTGLPRPAIPSIIATLQYIAPQAYSNIYVSAQSFGSATISHWANSTADKTYSYIIVG